MMRFKSFDADKLSCIIFCLNFVVPGEYCADDAWEFQELEEQIAKGYF